MSAPTCPNVPAHAGIFKYPQSFAVDEPVYFDFPGYPDFFPRIEPWYIAPSPPAPFPFLFVFDIWRYLKKQIKHTVVQQKHVMITDNQLYSLTLFLGFAMMLLIVLYHFLEVNSEDSEFAAAARSERAGVGAVKPEIDEDGALSTHGAEK